MKKFLLFSILCFVYTTAYSIPKNWENEIAFQENGITYTVGISDWRENTQRSIYDAYLNAMQNYNIFHNTTIDTEYSESFTNGKLNEQNETLRKTSNNTIKRAKIIKRKFEREPASLLVRVKLLIQFTKEHNEQKNFQQINLHVPLPYSLDRCLYTDKEIKTQFGNLSQGTHLLRLKNIVDKKGEYVHQIPFNTFLEECRYKILVVNNEHYGPYYYDEFHTPDGLHDDELVFSQGSPREKF